MAQLIAITLPRRRRIRMLASAGFLVLVASFLSLAAVSVGLWFLALLCIALVVFGLGLLIWQAWGRIRLIVTSTDLVAERSVWRVRHRSRHALQYVSRLRTERAEWESEPSGIAFDYSLRTVSFSELKPEGLRQALATLAEAVREAQRGQPLTAAEPPLEWRVRTSHNGGVLLERTDSGSNVQLLLLQGATITMLAIGLYSQFSSLVESGDMQPVGRVLAGALVVGVVLGIASLLRRFGRECVGLTAGELQIGRRYGPWVWPARYALSGLSRPRAERCPDTGGWSLLGYSQPQPSEYWAVVVERDGRSLVLGTEMAEQEARWLAQTLVAVGVGTERLRLDVSQLARISAESKP